MKFYIATAFRNKADHDAVRRLLELSGHQLTSVSPSCFVQSYDPKERYKPEVRRQHADSDIKGVLDADVLVALLPGGRGTYAEIGCALGAGIPVLMVAPPDAAESVFNHHPLVTVVDESLVRRTDLISKPWHDEMRRAFERVASRVTSSSNRPGSFPRRRGRTLAELQAAAHGNSCAHGFWDDQSRGAGLDYNLVLKVIPEKLCLIHSEVSEGLECYRSGDMDTYAMKDGEECALSEGMKPLGFTTELADVVIRCLDLAGALGIDLELEVERKMRYNATRPYKHNKVC